jgi:hypothetical protein
MKSKGRMGGWGFIRVMAEMWMSRNPDASSRPLFVLKQARIKGKYVSSSARWSSSWGSACARRISFPRVGLLESEAVS